MSHVVDDILKGITGNVEDPDKGDELYDFWIQSKCGRSSKTLTLPFMDSNTNYDFGVWEGKPCSLACLYLHMRRVGSTESESCPLVDNPLELVLNGGNRAVNPGLPIKITLI